MNNPYSTLIILHNGFSHFKFMNNTGTQNKIKITYVPTTHS